MSREHILNGVYVSETGTRSEILTGVYLNETASGAVTPPATVYAAFSTPQDDGYSVVQMVGI